MDVEEARKRERDARLKASSIKVAAEDVGRAAMRKAESAYLAAHDYDGAKDAAQEAVRARIAAEDALPAHEWEGRRVTATDKSGPTYNQKVATLHGIVETVRSTTVFAANASSWRQPDIGTAIVRLLKKDGTPALKFEKLERVWGSPWRLEE